MRFGDATRTSDDMSSDRCGTFIHALENMPCGAGISGVKLFVCAHLDKRQVANEPSQRQLDS